MLGRSDSGRVLVLLLQLALACPAIAQAAGGILEGTVIDAAGEPVAEAVVRIRAHAAASLTDATGRFRLERPTGEPGLQITAAKTGYVIAGTQVLEQATDYRLVLRPVPLADDPSYAWVSAYALAEQNGPITDTGREPCGTCHRRIVEEWRSSRHAGSATNPRFLAFFYGAGGAAHPGESPSFRGDFPNSNGNCAACHLPVLASASPLSAEPAYAVGVPLEGVGCDYCHKIFSVASEPDGGRVGAHAAALRRPGGDGQLVFGPLDDVPRGRDSFNPLYRDSRYCATCHDGGFWNIRAYSEFQEWQQTEFAGRGVQCQDCHMREATAAATIVDAGPEIVHRNAAGLSSHRFRDSRTPDFVRDAIDFRLSAAPDGDRLAVTASLTNIGAGHHLPAGTPMRHMILVLEATDAQGRALAPGDGERVPDYGGTESGPVEPMAGRPGKAYGKILTDRVTYTDRPGDQHFKPMYPAPHWRPTSVAADNRLAYGASDASAYSFALGASVAWPVTVTARLIVRRTFQAWALAQGLADIDLEVGRETVSVAR
ncbi:MAG: hypothetical protein HYR63_06025 [Proteobacteria bacterium]|nr:hypothetical protein [Pseudomonadota bacterium]